MLAKHFPTFFIISNLWFFGALVIFIGKHQERYEPYRYSFFGLPGWHTPVAYNSVIAAALIGGFASLTLAVVALRRSHVSVTTDKP